MKPELVRGGYVFCSVTKERFDKRLEPILIFKEDEGTTFILKREVAAAHSIPYSGVWAWITLTVHSDLAAVGFLAAITKELAEAGISMNAVSAYHHDHLFVPIDKAKKAMQILKELSK